MKQLNSYLTFNGNCREAMTFYQQCLGGDLQLMPFADMPGKEQFPEETHQRIMHAYLSNGPLVLMASDNMPGMDFVLGNNFSLALDCESVEQAQSLFQKLGASGKVFMPFEKTFWAERFGMLTDQFGVQWMVSYSGKPDQRS